MGSYLPAAAGVRLPAAPVGQQRATSRRLFEGTRVLLDFAHGDEPVDLRVSPRPGSSFMETAYGPTVKARAKASPPKAAGKSAAPRCSHWRSATTRPPTAAFLEAEYLITIGHKVD